MNSSHTCLTCPIRDFNFDHQALADHPIAYFCAEYGIEDTLPIYAGGLGILAGDFVRAAGERGIPIVAFGLLYRRGFSVFQPAGMAQDQSIVSPTESGFSLLKEANDQPILIAVEADSRIFQAQVWTKTYGSARLFLFDTDFDANNRADREITQELYDGRFEVRVLQELLLGVGGVKLLRKMNIVPSIYHLNEGHTSFAALALCVEYLHDHPNETSIENALHAIRPMIVATKHTILSSAGIHFTRDQFLGILDTYLSRHRASFDEFFALGCEDDHGPELFSTTKFLIESAIRENAVSMLHAVFEKREHPYGDLISITNGVNVKRWRANRWSSDNFATLTDQEIWRTHTELRHELVSYVLKTIGAQLNSEALTVVWARRFAAYKRPEILFSDLDRLAKLLQDIRQPVQFIIAGQASIHDSEGIKRIERIIAHTKEARFQNKVVYLSDYSIVAARKLVQGADVWLSTPIRGKEACGTSSMKASLNGVLQCSTSDGWLEEVDWSDKGWILKENDTETHMYETIENNIRTVFYDRDQKGVPSKWVKQMRNTFNVVLKGYTAERMIEDYLHKLYFPCETISPTGINRV
jgi:glycogen phosphorylase